MKNAIIITAMILGLASCNGGNSTKEVTERSESSSEQMYACSMHPNEKGKKGDKCPDCGMEMTVPIAKADNRNEAKGNMTKMGTAKELITVYLQIKNALANDDTNDAAQAGKSLVDAFKKFDNSILTAEQKKSYSDIEDDAREHAEHIGANGGKIEHQREHFIMLSNDMYDLAKSINMGLTLYQDLCPMANEGKGALWLSETKEIKNPYLGKKMPTCGSVKEELK